MRSCGSRGKGAKKAELVQQPRPNPSVASAPISLRSPVHPHLAFPSPFFLSLGPSWAGPVVGTHFFCPSQTAFLFIRGPLLSILLRPTFLLFFSSSSGHSLLSLAGAMRAQALPHLIERMPYLCSLTQTHAFFFAINWTPETRNPPSYCLFIFPIMAMDSLSSPSIINIHCYYKPKC